MLRKIISIKNVALFQDVASNGPLSIDFKKTTLVYGDNASGKSSLSAILKSVGTGDGTAIRRRKTNDQAGAQEVKLLLDSPAHFDGTGWSGAKPKIAVFDTDFVAENVYAGHAITTAHRRSLFVFALGDSVTYQQRLDQLTKEANEAARKTGEMRRGLESLARPYDVDKFKALIPDQDIDSKIASNQKEIDAANNSVAILARKLPEKLSDLAFDESAFFTILKLTLPDIEAEAEQVMRDHLAKHKTEGYSTWILEGRDHQVGEACPYCAQPVGNVGLINTYKNYFNTAYVAHKTKLDNLNRYVATLGEKHTLNWEGLLKANANLAEAWKPEYLCEFSPFKLTSVSDNVAQARELLKKLADRKCASPLEVVEDSADEAEISALLQSIHDEIRLYNTAIDHCEIGITAAKSAVTAANKATLEATKLQLAARKRRFDVEIVKVSDDYIIAEKESSRLAKEKKALKAKIDVEMARGLSEYMVKINEYLDRFSAKFRIVKLAPTFLGSGEPRAEYALEVRGKEINQLEKNLLKPGFDTILSEGDKRTLAFAFFMAKLVRHADLGEYTVVFDDPMTSLDMHRKRETTKVFQEVAAASKQLIILSHDCYFLREADIVLPSAAAWKICFAAQGYSRFETLDLEEMCRSPYEMNYHLLDGYVHGVSAINERTVAIALRPAVEGYLHRRYPGVFLVHHTLGSMVEYIAGNQIDVKFASITPAIVAKLRDFNDYARRFHHDSGTDFVRGNPNQTEVQKYSRIALGLIHTDGLKP